MRRASLILIAMLALSVAAFGQEHTAKPTPSEILDSLVVAGGPDRDFLGQQLHASPGPGIAPGDTGYPVARFVHALGGNKRTWKQTSEGNWVMSVEKSDEMSGNRLTVQMLLARQKGPQTKGVLPTRVILNRQELNQAQIFDFILQLAYRIDAGR